MSTPIKTIAAALLAGILTPVIGLADEPATPKTKVSFYKDVRPILQGKCQGCHQPAKQGGNYVMTEFAAMLKGGETGMTAILPGNAAGSHLLDTIRIKDGQAEMPKGQPPLSEIEVATIEKWIAEGAEDDSPKTAVTKFDNANPPKYELLPVITTVDYSADGKYLAISGYHEVLIWSADGKELRARLVGLSERISNVAFSPDSTRLAIAGGSPGRFGEVQVWDVEKQALITSKMVGYDTLYGVSWSADGKKIAFGCSDKTVRGVVAETGEQFLFNGAHDDWVLDTIFSKNNDHIVSVGRDRSMKLINIETQRFIDNITSITPGALKGGINAVDRHPTEDRLLCGGADGTPKVYKMFREQARQIGDDFNLIKAYGEMKGRVNDVKFTSDGAKVVAVSSHDDGGQLRVYKADDGQVLVNLDLPESGLFSVDVSHDNSHVAIGGFDGRVRIVSLADGKVVATFDPVPLTLASN